MKMECCEFANIVSWHELLLISNRQRYIIHIANIFTHQSTHISAPSRPLVCTHVAYIKYTQQATYSIPGGG